MPCGSKATPPSTYPVTHALQNVQVLQQTENPTPDELQTLYPNIVETQPAVHYVVNTDVQQLNQSQQIIVSGDQYMVLDNGGIAFQNQPFELQGQTQQIFYMDAKNSAQTVEAVLPEPVVLNHTLPQAAMAGAPQKVIMLQPQTQQVQAQPTMVIQQPMLQRQIQPLPVQKGVVHTRVQSPQQIQQPIAGSPRLILTGRPPINQGNKNIIRAPVSRPTLNNRTFVQQTDNTRPPHIINRTMQRPQMRPGVNSPLARPTGNQILNRGIMQNRAQFLQKNKVRMNSPINQNHTANIEQETRNADAVALEDGTVISIAEYQQLLAERKINAQKALQKAPPVQRTPINRRPAVNRTPVTKTNNIMPQTPQTITPLQPQVQQQTTPNVMPQKSQQSVPNQSLLSQQQQQQQQQIQQNNISQDSVSQKVKMAKIIQPVDSGRLPAVLRNFVPPPEIKDIISKTQHTAEFQNSVRMFVLLANGEQRLITFTMPKEDCTIQEILEQVGVPLQADTKISVSETNSDGINLVVSVGIADDSDGECIEAEEVPPSQAQLQRQLIQPQVSEPVKAPTPELPAQPEPEQPKYVSGMLAVCTHCGILSEDFNKCQRCGNKFPEGIKSVSANSTNKKGGEMQKKPTIAINLKNNGVAIGAAAAAKSPAKKKPKPKIIEQEPVILTLSSDDEADDDNNALTPTIEQLLKKAELTMGDSVLKEPTAKDIKDKINLVQKTYSVNKDEDLDLARGTLLCRTIRIGSYRFCPSEHVILTAKELIMKVPMPTDSNEIKTIRIERRHVVKVLINFQKLLPVIFYYVTQTQAEGIRKELGMISGTEPYFDSVSDEEAFKRITLLPEEITDEIKCVYKSIYSVPYNLLEELNSKEANNILLRTCPKEMSKTIQVISVKNEDVKQLFIYPPGRGGISINTEDFMCLAQDQFLNDVIIDFYLKYLVANLPNDQHEKVHVFSTFFYKRLTTKPTKPTRRSHPTELDSTLTAAEKRHARVKNWTKQINLFEKDFIVVPINENAHWFLAIICFPGMNGPHTFDGKPHKVEPIEKKKKIIEPPTNVTITTVKVEKVPVEEGDLSDKDEAEGDESELDSGEESEEMVSTTVPTVLPSSIPAPNPKTRTKIKQPCILIFDSLAGASRARVVATLRDYLTVEYKIKMGETKVFNKDVIKGACPKVPQQTNYTDCGLYLLQYVESFFKNPIYDYHIPINHLKVWFEEIVVTRKREDISNLIKRLMNVYRKDIRILPSILFPTLNGELVEHPPEEEEEEEEEECFDEEEDEDEEMETEASSVLNNSDKITDSESEVIPNSQESESSSTVDSTGGAGGVVASSKPTVPSVGTNKSFVEEPMETVVQPNANEVNKVSDRDTMSYLKAKRIIRHKPPGLDIVKKFKPSLD